MKNMGRLGRRGVQNRALRHAEDCHRLHNSPQGPPPVPNHILTVRERRHHRARRRSYLWQRVR